VNKEEHFTHAPEELQREYIKVLDKTAVEMGRTDSPTDRVDWNAVNEKLVDWWKDKGYEFP
jgi:hypothetical protein